jgi:hypothetical protein
MMRRLFLVSVLAVGTSSSASLASSIVVSAESTANICSLTMEAGVPVTVYALAVLGGDAAAPGITGAEFRILGFDPTWAVVSQPNPAQIADMGDPVGNGSLLLFGTCQQPSNQVVLLYTVTVLPFTVSAGRMVEVIEHANPSNSGFPCPWLLICNQPSETRLCVQGGVSCINGSAACCAVDPIDSTSWSQVKSLFAR